MIPVRFGMELEFVAECHDCYDHQKGIVLRTLQEAIAPHNVFRDGLPRDHNEDWNLGYDGSACNGYINGSPKRFIHPYGFELRSPIITEKRRAAHLKRLKAMLAVLKNIAVISKTSGMHVHISSPTMTARVVGRFMSAAILKTYGAETWYERERYCQRGYSTMQKYRTVYHHGGNHVEFRLFNGSFDYSEIVTRLDDAIEVYRRGLRYRGCNGLGRRVRPRAKPRVREAAAV